MLEFKMLKEFMICLCFNFECNPQNNLIKKSANVAALLLIHNFKKYIYQRICMKPYKFKVRGKKTDQSLLNERLNFKRCCNCFVDHFNLRPLEPWTEDAVFAFEFWLAINIFGSWGCDALVVVSNLNEKGGVQGSVGGNFGGRIEHCQWQN